jgi:hypothetical protein
MELRDASGGDFRFRLDKFRSFFFFNGVIRPICGFLLLFCYGASKIDDWFCIYLFYAPSFFYSRLIFLRTLDEARFFYGTLTFIFYASSSESISNSLMSNLRNSDFPLFLKIDPFLELPGSNMILGLCSFVSVFGICGLQGLQVSSN